MWAWSLGASPVLNEPLPEAAPPRAPDPGGRTTIIIQSIGGHVIYYRYKGRQSCTLGAIQILIGLGSILSWRLAAHFKTPFTNYDTVPFTVTGMGVCCGIVCIIPGSFGVASGIRKTYCLIVTCMVLNIVAIMLLVSWNLAGGFFGVGLNHHDSVTDCFTTTNDVYFPKTCEQSESLKLYIILCMLLSLAYLLVALWSCVICCMAVCCGTTSESATYVSTLETHALHVTRSHVQDETMSRTTTECHHLNIVKPSTLLPPERETDANLSESSEGHPHLLPLDTPPPAYTPPTSCQGIASFSL